MPSSPSAKQPPTPPGSVSTQLVTLAFDITTQAAMRLPNLLDSRLNEKDVQTAIKDMLDTALLQPLTMGQATDPLSAADAKTLIASMQQAPVQMSNQALAQQIKDSDEYKRLVHSIEDFRKAAQATSFGMWIDKNSNMLYITGIALVISGVAVLYTTQTKSAIANQIFTQIKNKPVQIFKIGKFSLDGKVLAFQPEKRILGAGTIATANLQSLQIKVGVDVIAANTKIQQINSSIAFKTSAIDLGLTANEDMTKNTLNLGVTVGLSDTPLKTVKVGVGALLWNNQELSGVTFNATAGTPVGDFTLKGQVGHTPKGGNADGVFVLWSIPLGSPSK